MRCRRLIAASAAVLALTLSALAAAQTPDEPPAPSAAETFEDALDTAENRFVYGEYDRVVEALRPVLLPNAPEGVSVEVLVRAYALLGTSAFFDESFDVADAAFLEALLRDPRFRLDPLLYPPRVIERFESVRERNAARLDVLLNEDDGGAVVYIERDVQRQSRLVSMLPFGYGFFAADRDVAGLSYAVAEGAVGGAMFVLFLTNHFARRDDGHFDNPVAARNRADAQLVLAGVFTATVIANALHGALTHERSTRINYRTLTEPPPELSGDRPSSRQRSRGWRVSFVPVFRNH